MSHKSRKVGASALNQPDLFTFAAHAPTSPLTQTAELRREKMRSRALKPSASAPKAPRRPDHPTMQGEADKSSLRREASAPSQNNVPPPTNPIDQRLIKFIVGGAGRGRPFKKLREEQITDSGRLLDVREAARRLGLSKSTLDKMRCSGSGPRFIRATDRAVRYDPADLDAFADERRRRSTSEEIVHALRR